MGSQTILDLIASTVVFGSLLVIALRLNMSTSGNLQMYQGDLLVQQNLVEITRLLEYDFKKIGYCADPTKITDPSQSIRFADSSRIKFYTDFATDAYPEGDGNLDSLTYYVGEPNDPEVLITPNPDDRLLYRVENNSAPIGVNLGVTKFKIRYYDTFKDSLPLPVANCSQIQYMQITIQVENLVPSDTIVTTTRAKFDEGFQKAYWRQMRLSARNLKNR